MLGMFLLFRTFGTLDFTQLFDKVTNQQWPMKVGVSSAPLLSRVCCSLPELAANRRNFPFMSGCLTDGRSNAC